MRMRAVPFFIVVGVLVDVNALVRQAAGGHATPPSLREAKRSLPPGPKGRLGAQREADWPMRIVPKDADDVMCSINEAMTSVGRSRSHGSHDTKCTTSRMVENVAGRVVVAWW